MLNFIRLLSKELDLYFHLIGSFAPKGLEDEVKNFISNNKLIDKIKIYGMLPFPEAQKIVRQCDIGLLFLHPIINNLTILATKMFEYMGNGLAVLMSDFPLWVKFNKKYNCGRTLDIFDIPNEKLKIQDFLQNKEKINQIRSANIQTVKEKFVWEIEEKKLLNLYEQMEN
jgi:glycosyltransferase involved in cell wall biosynthesis